MDLLNRFVNRIDFDSYEDFKQNFKINVPEDFNFGFDVVDVYAKEVPDQEALIWCDDDGNEKHFILFRKTLLNMTIPISLSIFICFPLRSDTNRINTTTVCHVYSNELKTFLKV